MPDDATAHRPRGAADPDLRDLARLSVVAAPMAGGLSTVALVAAAAEAGAVGLLAGGYKTPDALRRDIEAVQAATAGPFGVNLFVPSRPTNDTSLALARYVDDLRPVAAELGVEPGEPTWDDDGWDAKLRILHELCPPIVSFTFGCPAPDIIAQLRAKGVHVTVTVTSPGEAHNATAAGASSLCVQGPEAGGHRATFTNRLIGGPGLVDLLRLVRQATPLPLLAAGGLAQPEDVIAVHEAGAVAAQLGTALLCSPEAGTAAAHRAVLTNPGSPDTVITAAFSGRPARGIHNWFIAEHPNPPAAYPEVNNVTRPIRSAAAQLGRSDALHLWAGTGYRRIRPLPAGEILTWLDPAVRRRF